MKPAAPPPALSAPGRTPPRRIESRANARVKQLRAALAHPAPNPSFPIFPSSVPSSPLPSSPAGRQPAPTLIAMEGEHLVAEALRSGLRLRTVFLREGSEALLHSFPSSPAGSLASAAAVEILLLTPEVFASAVTTENPQGIAALAEAPHFALDPVLDQAAPLLLIAAGLQDPGNLGALVRSAEAFGAAAVLALPGTVSIWNAKALRASSGSAFRLPVVAITPADAFAALARRGIRVLAAVAPGPGCAALPADEAALTGATAIIIGNEGAGLSPALLARAQGHIAIPCPGPVESLNAAVAGSILLYEAARRRSLHARAPLTVASAGSIATAGPISTAGPE